MPQTNRFGFNWFDDSNQGSTTADGGKFTGQDRLTIDQLLAAIETHNHQFSVDDTQQPTTAPTTALGTGGSLPAGVDQSYVVTFVDADGLETPAGAEVTVTVPDPLDTPEAPGASTNTTGTLATGLYDYAVTAMRGTEQSPLGDLATVTLVVGDSSVDFNLPTVSGADYLRLWRRKSTEGGFTLIEDNIITTTTTDDGSVAAYPCATDPSYAPPAVNQGADIYSVTVTLSTADAAIVDNFAAWRLYRTDVAGHYSAQSLVALITAYNTEGVPASGLVTEWIDYGDELATGTPPLVDTRMHFTALQIATYANLSAVPAESYPEGYPIIADGILYAYLSGSFTALGGGTGGASYQGEWNSGTTYAVGDLVTYNGALYHASAASTAEVPGTPGAAPGEFGDAVIDKATTYGMPATSEMNQRFVPASNMTISQIDVYVPSDATFTPGANLEINAFQGTDPGGTYLDTATRSVDTLTLGAWNTITFAGPISLASGLDYVFDIYLLNDVIQLGLVGAPSDPVGLTSPTEVSYWDGAGLTTLTGYYFTYNFPEYAGVGSWDLVLDAPSNAMTITEATHSMASLADAANGIETATVFPKMGIVYEIETSAAARVRLYASSAQATADASRSFGTPPSSVNHGLLCDVLGDGSNLVLTANDMFHNGETPRVNELFLSVTNVSGGTAAIDVTLRYVVLEP